MGKYIVFKKKVSGGQARFLVYCPFANGCLWVAKNDLRNPDATYLRQPKK